MFDQIHYFTESQKKKLRMELGLGLILRLPQELVHSKMQLHKESQQGAR